MLNFRNKFGYYIYTALKRKMNKKKFRKKSRNFKRKLYILEAIRNNRKRDAMQKDELLRKDIMHLENYKKYFSII